MQISLKTLFVLVTFFAFGCAALKHANQLWWSGASGLCLITFIGIAIVAAVGRGERRAFCIGFVIGAVIYATALAFGASSKEFSTTYSGRLSTSYPLRLLYDAIAVDIPIDPMTGKELRGGELTSSPTPFVGSRGYAYRAYPTVSWFMRIGHLVWAILIGFCSGIFARYVYAREKRVAGEDEA